MNNQITKTNIMLKLAAILLCLVLITTHFTSGLYAKYISRSSDDTSARVASFVIETDLDRIALGTEEMPTLQLGGEDETQSVQLPFYITSGSEVTVGYSVSIDFGRALPDYLSITLTDGANPQTVDADGTRSEFVFADFGTLPPGAAETQKAQLTLKISVSDLTRITDEVSVSAAELTVKVWQVD